MAKLAALSLAMVFNPELQACLQPSLNAFHLDYLLDLVAT
jgi:hypothetical protein